MTVRRREASNVIWWRASCAATMTQQRLVVSYGGADDGHPRTRPGQCGQCNDRDAKQESRSRRDCAATGMLSISISDAATTAHIST